MSMGWTTPSSIVMDENTPRNIYEYAKFNEKSNEGMKQ